MNTLHHVLALTATICLLAISGCGGGSGGDPAPTATTAAAPSAGSHHLDDLKQRDEHVARHQTVMARLAHPQSAEAERAVVRIPYHFEHDTVQQVCLDPQNPHGHWLEVHAAHAPGLPIAVIRPDARCQDVAFAAGRHDIVVRHGGGGASDASVHVFSNAVFAATDVQSAFGQRVLQAQARRRALVGAAAPQSAPRQRLDDGGSCTLVETIALKDKARGAYLDATVTAEAADPFELNGVKHTALMVERNKDHPPPPAAMPSVPNQIKVYACGSTFKLQAVSGKFLKSTCGYPMFSADSLADATPYDMHWQPGATGMSLNLVNAQTGHLLQMVHRSAGRVMNPQTLTDIPHQAGGMGSCEAGRIPADLERAPSELHWSRFTDSTVGMVAWTLQLASPGLPSTRAMLVDQRSDKVWNQVYGVDRFMLTEVRHTGRTPVWLPVVKQGVAALPVLRMTQTLLFGTGPANTTTTVYSPTVEHDSGVSSNHQIGIAVTFGKCQQCDLSGLNLDQRSDIDTLDFTGSVLTGASFKGTSAASLTLDRATLTRTDFSDARFASSSFRGARLSEARFLRTQLRDERYGSSFQGAVITDETRFDSVTLDGVDFSQASITNGSPFRTFASSSLLGTRFDGATLDKVIFDQSPAGRVSFKDSKLTAVDLAYADLTQASFSGAVIVDSTFDYAFVVGSDFRGSTWTGSNFSYVQAYSDGTLSTDFGNCTVSSGTFANSEFMQSSFRGCRLQGGSFAGSRFVAADFQGVTAKADAQSAGVDFANALLAGVDFSGASLEAGSLVNAITSRGPGSVDLLIVTVPQGAADQPGQSVTRTYNYKATVRPGNTTTQLRCPDGRPGPCASDARWTPTQPPTYKGKENPDSWN